MKQQADEETLSHVVHAMLSPISSIYSLTDAILRGVDGHINDKVRRDVKEIAEDAARLQAVLEATIELLRLDYEKHQIARLPAEEAIRLVVAEVQVPAEGRSVELRIDESIEGLHADGAVLKVVLRKLLQHAFRLASDNRVTLEAAVDAAGRLLCVVVPGTGPQAHYTEAEVTDNFAQTQLHGVSSVDLLFCQRLLKRGGGTLLACRWPGYDGVGWCVSLPSKRGAKKT